MKYSSGKKELLLICSSGISPLKLSLRACRKQTQRDEQEGHEACFLRSHWTRLRGKKNTKNTLVHLVKRHYLQCLVDDTGRAWRAGSVVIQLLLQAAKQAAEVGGRVVGPGTTVLDGTEGFWEQAKLPKTLLEKTISRLGGFILGKKKT